MDKDEIRDEGIDIPIVGGIDKALEFVSALTDEIAEYRGFAEDVLLACSMPDVPRFSIEHDGDISHIGEAAHFLYLRMSEYRKMTEWFRKNNIDIDTVLGNKAASVKKKN